MGAAAAEGRRARSAVTNAQQGKIQGYVLFPRKRCLTHETAVIPIVNISRSSHCLAAIRARARHPRLVKSGDDAAPKKQITNTDHRSVPMIRFFIPIADHTNFRSTRDCEKEVPRKRLFRVCCEQHGLGIRTKFRARPRCVRWANENSAGSDPCRTHTEPGERARQRRSQEGRKRREHTIQNKNARKRFAFREF